MVRDAHIRVSHLTRVEGHGNIVATIEKGRLAEARFEIVEAPRLFESFLRGYGFSEVVHMASRVCGICAVSHKCAALKATEAAFGTRISEQTLLLRRLAFHGEVLSSHILHVYFLAGPDFLGVPSIFSLLETEPEIVHRAMNLKNLGYRLCAAVAGRHTHPVAMAPGGFTFVHCEEALSALRSRLEQAFEDLKATVTLVKTFTVPEFERETEYVSLKHPDHYAFYDGDVFSSEGSTISADRYRDAVKEYVLPYSTAKHARWNRPQCMVGALARINNNYEQLLPMAKTVAEDLNLKSPCYNPFMNTVAQVVECAHCLEESLEILTRILNRGISSEEEMATVIPRQGQGVGAVEAPRGILFHDYTYDREGTCVAANMVIPTAQNLANLEEDMRALVPQIVERDEGEITRRLEMLVRAYDPCVSCSTHTISRTGG